MPERSAAKFGSRSRMWRRLVAATSSLAAAGLLSLCSCGGNGSQGQSACSGAWYCLRLEDRGNVIVVPTSLEPLTLDLGAPAYIEVVVAGYHRNIEASAQVPIHTYVNDQTSADPHETGSVPAGSLASASTLIPLRTLRMYDHRVDLTFHPIGGNGLDSVVVPVEIRVNVPPRAVLIGTDRSWLGVTPFEDRYGPDCSTCDDPASHCSARGEPVTTQRCCMGVVNNLDLCRPWGAAYNDAGNAAAVRAALGAQAWASQVVRDGPTDQNHVFLDEDRYAWDVVPGQTHGWIADWTYNHLKPNWGGHWSIGTGLLPGATWMSFCGAPCRNTNGSTGLFDHTNGFLMEQFGNFTSALGHRYRGKVHYYELANEPAAEFWLCGCTNEEGVWDKSVCTDNEAMGGQNLPVCWWSWDGEQGRYTGGPYAREFVTCPDGRCYGNLLLDTAAIAANRLAVADPEAILITGETDTPSPGTQYVSAVTRYFIEQGYFADHPNTVLGVHSYPQVPVNLWLGDIDCAYAGAFNYYLDEGCETAPPLSGTFAPHPGDPPRPVRELWIAQDCAADLSELLAEIAAMQAAGERVSLDELRLFDTEIHSGWHEEWNGRRSALTDPAREAIAGLRLAAIMAHQGFVGIEFTNGPADPTVFNLLVKSLSGAVPVWRPDSPRIVDDPSAYNGVVAKLFNRGREDVIAIWNNGETTGEVRFEGIATNASFKDIGLLVLALQPGVGGDAAGLVGNETRLVTPPGSLAIEPLTEFVFLSVVSDRPGFGWLGTLGFEDDASVGAVRGRSSLRRRGGV